MVRFKSYEDVHAVSPTETGVILFDQEISSAAECLQAVHKRILPRPLSQEQGQLCCQKSPENYDYQSGDFKDQEVWTMHRLWRLVPSISDGFRPHDEGQDGHNFEDGNQRPLHGKDPSRDAEMLPRLRELPSHSDLEEKSRDGHKLRRARAGSTPAGASRPCRNTCGTTWFVSRAPLVRGGRLI